MFDGRKGAWVYSNKTNFVIVIKHPHIINSLIIFPEVCDDSDLSLTTKVIQSINDGRSKIYLCRYTDLGLAKLNAKSIYGLTTKKL